MSSASLRAFPNKDETYLPVTKEPLRLGRLEMGSPKKSGCAVGIHTLEKSEELGRVVIYKYTE